MKLTQCFTPPIIENVKHLFKLKDKSYHFVVT